MHIGVFGDSYTTEVFQDRPNESWLQCIRDKGIQVTSHGCTGTSTWYSYKQFMKNFHRYTHIVFSYSSVNRIHYLPEPLKSFSGYYAPGLTSSSMFTELDPDIQQQYHKIVDAYPHLQDSDLDKFVNENIFNTVNSLSAQRGKKIVNLLPFHTTGNDDNFDLTNRKGPCITGIVTVSMKEMPELFANGWTDSRFCHLSQENNKTLSEMIMEFFHNNDPSQVLNGAKSDRFIYDKPTARRYQALLGRKK